MRYRLDFAYRGTSYYGFQVQPEGPTVQGAINHALSTILRTPVSTSGSSRTDTGVHARHQVLHFDVEQKVPHNLLHKLNSFTGPDLSFSLLEPVSEAFHSRFDAKFRRYEYWIHQKKDPFLEGLSYFYRPGLDEVLMNEAAKHLLSETDFESFSRVKTDVKTFNCDVRHAEWQRLGTQLVFTIEADRFLRGMVRAIVGTLMEVGLSHMSAAEFLGVIQAKDRKAAGRAAPAEGLFLVEVGY